MTAQPGPRRAEVVVVDRSNAPAGGLTVRDFVVREDGVPREVASVTPAAPPSPIVLLVDNSQAAEPSIAYLRKALSDFVASFAARENPPRLGVWTFGERPTKVVTEATAAVVAREIERLFHRPSTGAHMLQAIVEACADLVKANAGQPALVAFVVESGVEFSQEDHLRVAQALRRAGATLWVVALQSRASALNESLENRERAAVIGDVSVESGGLNLMVLSPQGLPDAFAQLQRILTSRLSIAYARPESLVPPERLEITTTRDDLRVLTPRWTGR
jgi:hypothetical protein